MFTHIDVNFYIKYEGHQNWSKILSMDILRVFDHHHIWCQNWCQYVWTSLCQFIFFVNLIHSPCVWLFDIWHLFHNLTSFWQLDIFFDIWAIEHMGNRTHGWGGTYLGQGLSTLAWGGTHLFWTGIYAGHGGTFLSGAVLTLTGATTLSWGNLPLLWGGCVPWSWRCTFLGDLRRYFSLGGCDGPERISL